MNKEEMYLKLKSVLKKLMQCGIIKDYSITFVGGPVLRGHLDTRVKK